MDAGALRIEIELPRDLLAALNIAESELGRRAQEWVVLELLQEGEISAGKAAEILGMTKARLVDLLAQRGLPYLDASAPELQRELAAAEAAAKPRD
jgi:predicted HTH domain antitoxin